MGKEDIYKTVQSENFGTDILTIALALVSIIVGSVLFKKRTKIKESELDKHFDFFTIKKYYHFICIMFLIIL